MVQGYIRFCHEASLYPKFKCLDAGWVQGLVITSDDLPDLVIQLDQLFSKDEVVYVFSWGLGVVLSFGLFGVVVAIIGKLLKKV